jgi:hypothetical protein
MRSKELINTLMNDEPEHFLTIMARAADGQDTTESKLCSLVEARCHFIAGRPRQLSKEKIVESHSLCSLFDPVRDRYLQPLKKLVEHILLEGMRKGELKDIDDLGLFSCMFMIFMVGCDYIFVFSNRHELISDGIRQMVGIFIAGTKKEPTCQ